MPAATISKVFPAPTQWASMVFFQIYDKVRTGDGKEKRVLNKAETMVAQQKQEMIREAFKEGTGESSQTGCGR